MVLNVDARTRQRGSSDTSWTRYLVFVLLSVMLHVIPVVAYFASFLVGLTWFRSDAGDLEDQPTIIPVELVVDELGKPKSAKPPEALPIKTATLEEPSAPPEASHKTEAAADAGVEDAARDAEDAAADAERDAPADVVEDAERASRDAREEEAADAADAQRLAEDAEPDAVVDKDAAVAALPGDSGAMALASDGGSVGASDGSADAADGAGGGSYEPIRDPVAVAGDARLVAQRNPNVSLMVFTARIRRHPLAARHAATLTSIQQWHAFFDGTGLDPVRDTDWILLAGPQFRRTDRISVVLRYTVPEARIRAAVATLMARSQPPGTWGEKNGVRYARLRIDNAERFIVMPQPKILVIVPPDGLDQAVNLKSARFPSGEGDGTAVLLNLKTPRNAFRGLPANIPASIAWVKFSLSLVADGGADARIDAEDSDAATAAKDAEMLTDQLEKLAVVRVLFVQQRLFDPIVFRSDGNHIRASTHLSEAQLNTILSMIGAEVDRQNKGASP